MQYRTIIRILGLLICIFSFAMLPPAVVSVIYRDGGGLPFVLAFVFAITAGLAVFYPNRNQKADLRAREGFLIVVFFWLVLGSFGALPFIFSTSPEISVADAFFESFSGLTTTGATVLTGLDSLPKSFLFYRQQLQWFGGMGIIVLAVAILPLLGVGGMQLYRAETPGPMKDSKMTPRIADTAKNLWYIYVALTAFCALAYWLAGMSVFDAICHAFSTIAIGGFSTHDASLAYFDSQAINSICVFFLLVSAANFSLHFTAWKHVTSSKEKIKSILTYIKDPEYKTFIAIQVVLVLICWYTLVKQGVFDDRWEAFDQGLFQAVSISTTAGFATTDFSSWPLFLPILLIFSSFIGGCASSTGGGLKVIRVLLLFKQGVRELNRLVHPKAIFSIKIGKKALPDRVLEAVWGFFSAYTLVFVVIMLALIASGMDNLTAFTATAACLNNLGPGLGEVAANYQSISDTGKWILMLAMVFGRLEVFTLLVLFTPSFWRS